jgi:hypothetical protein
MESSVTELIEIWAKSIGAFFIFVLLIYLLN